MGVAILPPPGWNDIVSPATQTRLGSNSKPDFDFTNIGLLFPQNDTGEKVYITGQMPHSWEGSDGRRAMLYPHIHYIQTGATLPVFDLQYRFYKNGGTVPSFTTISTYEAILPYTSGTILQILEFPEIFVSGLGSSAWYDMILYRNDNVVSGDVLVKGFDFHARFDDLGSRQVINK